MTGDIALSAGGRLDNPLYILFCQLTSLLVGLRTLFFSFVDCLSRISPTSCSPALWVGMSPKHNATTKPTALLLQKLVKTFPRVVCLILG